MTALRVLTGLHAGASIALAEGLYCLSGEDESADVANGSAVIRIKLFDWSVAALNLEVDSRGAVRARMVEGSAPFAVHEVWNRLEVRSFGPVDLCLDGDDLFAEGRRSSGGHSVGPVDPGSLLQNEKSGSRRVGAWAGNAWRWRAGVVGAGMLVAVSALYGHTGGSVRDRVAKTDFNYERLARALAVQGLNELRVYGEGGALVVSGLVRNADEGQSAHMAVAEFLRGTGAPLVARWEVADDIASTIETALHHPGVNVVYQGNGRFLIKGAVADLESSRLAVDSIRKDLGANVRSMEVALHAVQHPVSVNAAIAAGALEYSERSDGAKVFARTGRGG